MLEEAQLVRDGLFLCSNRVYGETYIEPLIKTICGLDDREDSSHDAILYEDGQKYKVEIKASKILAPRETFAETYTIADELIAIARKSSNEILNRYIDSADAYTADYSANIQNVKRSEFDYLYYVLLFKDCIWIFRTASDDINKENISNWSDHHGRYDEEGMSGQFAINSSNIEYHISNFFLYEVTWDEVLEYYLQMG